MLHVRADDLRQLANVVGIPLVDVVDLHDVRHLDTKAKRTGAFCAGARRKDAACQNGGTVSPPFSS